MRVPEASNRRISPASSTSITSIVSIRLSVSKSSVMTPPPALSSGSDASSSSEIIRIFPSPDVRSVSPPVGLFVSNTSGAASTNIISSRLNVTLSKRTNSPPSRLTTNVISAPVGISTSSRVKSENMPLLLPPPSESRSRTTVPIISPFITTSISD